MATLHSHFFIFFFEEFSLFILLEDSGKLEIRTQSHGDIKLIPIDRRGGHSHSSAISYYTMFPRDVVVVVGSGGHRLVHKQAR